MSKPMPTPMALSTAVSMRTGEYAVLEAHLPEQDPAPIGVLLLDRDSQHLALKTRRDWQDIAGDDNTDDAEVLELLAEQIQKLIAEQGAAALTWLEQTASNTLRITDRETVIIGNFQATLTRLYQKLVPVPVKPYQTHVPFYSCRAAAGSFSETQQVSQAEGDEGWIEVPAGALNIGKPLREGLFAAEVTGRSMEPRIPDGSLCLFRAPVIGSRHGRLVLVENLDESDEGGERYTIKRYHRPPGAHAVVMQPLNPEFPAWEIDEEAAEAGRIRVIAEFVQTFD
jgi:phage repressor protein C with HTH and peptisase S24 domain